MPILFMVLYNSSKLGTDSHELVVLFAIYPGVYFDLKVSALVSNMSTHAAQQMKILRFYWKNRSIESYLVHLLGDLNTKDEYELRA